MRTSSFVLARATPRDRQKRPMTKVYISSTYRDLVEHRRVLYDALRKNGYDVIAMEDYVAADERPVDRCLADVRSCGLYIGLFARCYGFMPPGETRSITELEFREAVESRIPRLCFVLDENVARNPADEDEDPTRIDQFKREIQEEITTAAFHSPEHLAVEVLSALNRRRNAGLGGVIHVVDPELKVPEWADSADVRFSVTNNSDVTMKVAELKLIVKERQQIDDVRLHLQGAPVQEFELRADIRDSDEVDLLKGLEVQFITPAGESEAMKLIIECGDGFRYACALEGSHADVRNGKLHPLQPAHFTIVHPISSLDTLRSRRSTE